MSAFVDKEVAGQLLRFGERFLRIENALFIADVHLGKTAHFRKAGLPLPRAAAEADLRALWRLIDREMPQQLVVLGDLFHSVKNAEAEDLMTLTTQFPEVEFVLVRGNHDVMDAATYRSLDFEVKTEWQLGGLLMTHEPMPMPPAGTVNVHGHLHPGVKLRGKGRQSIMVPCFHLTKRHLVLPAFGALTGLMAQRVRRGDTVIGVAPGAVWEI